MSAETILEQSALMCGWSIDTQLFLCLEYIENQKNNDAFEDFINQRVDEEAGEQDFTDEDDDLEPA